VHRVTIDPEAGAAYLYLSEEPVARTVDHGPFIADYDAAGRVRGIELLHLHDLPEPAAILDALGEAGAGVAGRVTAFIEQIRLAGQD
jgi:uncharacterized protein YuzE